MNRFLVEGTFLLITYLIGIIIVILVITVCFKLKLQKSPQHIHFIHLQFLMLYRLLFCFTHNLPEYFEYILYGRIRLPRSLEKFLSYLDQLAWYLVIFNHVLISIYRYIAICWPNLSEKLRSRRKIYLSLIIVWIIGFTLVSVPAFFSVCCAEVFHYHVDGDDIREFIDDTDIFVNNNELYFNRSSMGQFMEPMNFLRYFTLWFEMASVILCIACFWKIKRKLQAVSLSQECSNESAGGISIIFVGHQTDNNYTCGSFARETRRTLQCFFVVLIFTAASFFVFILHFVQRSAELITGMFFVYCFNACADAVIIIWFNPRFSAILIKWLKCSKTETRKLDPLSLHMARNFRSCVRN